MNTVKLSNSADKVIAQDSLIEDEGVYSSPHFLDLFKRKKYLTKCDNSGALLSLTITRRIKMNVLSL